MAEGTVVVFEEFAIDSVAELHNWLLGNDTVKVGLIDNAQAPTAADASPTWSDYSGNEVSGTGYSAGGSELTYTYTEADGVGTFDYTDLTFSYNAAGPTDAYYAIFYNDSATNKNAFAYMDLDGPKSMQVGDITLSANASGLLTITVSNS